MMEVVVTTGLVVQSSSQIITTNKPTIQFFYMPDVLPVAQPSVKTLKGKYHIRWTCLSQAYLGSSNFVSDH